MSYPQTEAAFTSIAPSSLVGRRRCSARANTLLYQLDVLRKTGRYDAFRLKWHPTYDEAPLVWPIPNHLFWDSDVAKWIEGACYFLKHEDDRDVVAAIDELVDMIRSAQQPDGYLNIHYTVVEPGKRFTNLRDMHELYNAGHLIEAALAHNEVFGNDRLLEPILKYVQLFSETFGPSSSQLHGYPGHPEVELALLRLYDRTRDPSHLELASYFITERGNPTGCEGKNYFMVEAEKRGADPNKRPAFYPEPSALWYHQAHAPIVDQPSVEGHAVRAVYLLTAVADLIRIDDTKPELKNALYRLWDNMVGKKMYVTGGIGATKQWEGFNLDYFLPQSTDEGGCYSETCASIGVMMLANRLLQIDRNARFTDVLELCLYNTVLSSMSHDGKRFTYENQLASSKTDLSCREEWFVVACCPPNILRLLGQIGGYVWSHQLPSSKTEVMAVTSHLYISSTLEFAHEEKVVKISQSSNWPWSGDIDFHVERADLEFEVNLRIPGWAKSWEIQPRCPEAQVKDGYVTLPASWVAQNQAFRLTIPITPRWVVQHPNTRQNTVILARGPVIYCVEDVDNSWVEDHFKDISVDPSVMPTENTVKHDISGDEYVALQLRDGAYTTDSTQKPGSTPFVDLDDVERTWGASKPVPELNFIPYYFRANRGGRGHMRVGLRRK